METLKREGHIQAYAMTQDVETAAMWVLNKGPVVIGCPWKEGMFRVDSLGFIHNTGPTKGGHCVVIDGVTWDYEQNRMPGGAARYFRIRNSWSSKWGFNGRCRLSAADLQALVRDNGVIATAVEVA